MIDSTIAKIACNQSIDSKTMLKYIFSNIFSTDNYLNVYLDVKNKENLYGIKVKNRFLYHFILQFINYR